MKRNHILLTSSMSLLAGLLLAVEPQAVQAQFVAPAESSPAYMGDKVVVPQNFDTTAEAIEYAKAHFDYQANGNWYVRGDQNGGYVYFDRYVEPTGGTVTETVVTPEAPAPQETPQTQPQTPAPALSTASTHTINYGDTLWSIARRNNLTVQELKDLNGLTSDNVPVGTQLKLTKAQTTTPTQSTPSQSSSTTGGNYNVKAGDSLWKIAQANGTTVSELRRLNNLRGDFLQVGDQLKLPGRTQTVPSNPTPAPATTDSTYTVKSGDYLYKIAKQYGVTVAQLKAWNHLTSDALQVGDVLKVQKPAQSGQTTRPNSTPTVEARTHTIVAGDTLWDIAQANRMTVKELMDLNGLTSTNVPIGAILRLTKGTVTEQPAPVKPTTTNQVYTVKSGDYLYKIANQYGVTVDQLKAWNNLTSNFLQVGDKLTVKTSSPSSTRPSQPSNTNTSNTSTYTVKSGDYLYKIAGQYGTTVDAIKRLNNMQSNDLQIGDVLRIPTRSGGGSTVSRQPVTYTVKSGDYLYKIANRHGVTVDQLKAWNNLTSDALQVGNTLVIRK